MKSMNGNSYKLLGFVVWRGAKWYTRRRYLDRLPSARSAALTGLGAIATGVVVVTVARRALG
jgi:hypothetical protein